MGRISENATYTAEAISEIINAARYFEAYFQSRFITPLFLSAFLTFFALIFSPPRSFAKLPFHGIRDKFF